MSFDCHAAKDTRFSMVSDSESSSSSDARSPYVAGTCNGSTRLVAIGCGLWLLGVVVMMRVEDIGFLEASYIITQIVTTIGYGDLTFDNDRMKIFMSIYILAILVFCGFISNAAVSYLMDKEMDILRSGVVELEKYAMVLEAKGDDEADSYCSQATVRTPSRTRALLGIIQKLNVAKLAYATFCFMFFVASGTWFFSAVEPCACSYGKTRVDGCTEENACEVGKHHSIVDALYMSVVTMTTVGFGDVVPMSKLGRIVAIPWMLVGISITAFFLSSLQELLYSHRASVRAQIRDMKADEFKAMDTDRNGSVSKYEFVMYMLLREGLLEEETVGKLEACFDAIDRQGTGEVSWDTIIDFGKKAKAKRKA